MDWLDCMNRAMDYIEANLADEISYDKAAQIACCSTYHFQRMFSFITSVPLSEYIRRRRLTLAAFELQTTDVKVIDVALKYGYESPEAFARAFKNLHGVMPSSARKEGVVLKTYPRMTFRISIKGDIEMDYRIEEKEAFEVFGVGFQTNVINGKCFKEISAFWEQFVKSDRYAALLQDAGKQPGELLDFGVTYAHNPNGSMNYMIACLKKTEQVPVEYTVLSIPKQTWAVFNIKWESEQDDKNVHDTWRRIYAEWFPASSYEHAECDFDLEYFFGSSQKGYGVEIMIPVRKK